MALIFTAGYSLMFANGAKNILLVEGNPNNAEPTLHALKKNNILNPIDIGRNGEQAIGFLYSTVKFTNSNHDFSTLILLDLKLPKVGEIEVLRRINKTIY